MLIHGCVTEKWRGWDLVHMQKRVNKCACEELDGCVNGFLTEGDMEVKQTQIVALSSAVLHTRSSGESFTLFIFQPLPVSTERQPPCSVVYQHACNDFPSKLQWKATLLPAR